MVRCHHESHEFCIARNVLGEMRPWQRSGDIVMANKWFKECKALFLGQAMNPERDMLRDKTPQCSDVSLRFLIGLSTNVCACVFVYSNVCWVPFYALPSNVNDLNMFAVPGCWNQRWCSTLCLHGGGSCQGHCLQHFLPSCIADKGSSSSLSWHVLEKLKLNLKTLQLCLFLLPVILQLCMHYFYSEK